MWFHHKDVLTSPFDEGYYIKHGLTALIGEADKWIPLSKADNTNLSSTSENIIVVGEDRIQAVDKLEECMFSIYWEGPKQAVRESLWFLLFTNADLHPATSLSMNSKEQICSYVPLPQIWQSCIEAKFQESLEWIDSPSSEGIERIVPLDRPFNSLLLSFNAETKDIFLIADEEAKQRYRLIRGSEQLLTIKSLAVQVREDKSCEVEHLVLAVHGIGQKFAGKMGHSFIEDVDSFRNSIKSISVAKGISAGKVSVLPVCWRTGTALFERDDFEDILQKITLQSVPLFRSLISDAALDILLYMSTRHCDRIQSFIINEIIRLVLLFRQHNPGFAGKVHVLAHSLGSALIADVLSCQNQLQEHSIKLGIIFTLGSPASLFGLLKEEAAIQPCADVALYNIYHPTDPIAYRMEPLVLRERPELLEPAVPIPSSSSLLANMVKKVTSKVSERFLGVKTSQAACTNPSPSVMTNPLYRYNPRGRVDYCLQQGFFETDYIASLRAHFCYWHDRDVASFVLNEVYSSIYST